MSDRFDRAGRFPSRRSDASPADRLAAVDDEPDPVTERWLARVAARAPSRVQVFAVGALGAGVGYLAGQATANPPLVAWIAAIAAMAARGPVARRVADVIGRRSGRR